MSNALLRVLPVVGQCAKSLSGNARHPLVASLRPMIARVKLCLVPFLQEEEDRSSQLFGLPAPAASPRLKSFSATRTCALPVDRNCFNVRLRSKLSAPPENAGLPHCVPVQRYMHRLADIDLAVAIARLYS